MVPLCGTESPARKKIYQSINQSCQLPRGTESAARKKINKSINLASYHVVLNHLQEEEKNQSINLASYHVVQNHLQRKKKSPTRKKNHLQGKIITYKEKKISQSINHS